PVHDVKAMFGDIVAIAPSADLFVAACRQALGETAEQKDEREQRMAERVRKHSWDAAAETIRRSLDTILAAPRASVPGAATSSSMPVERGGPASVNGAITGVGRRADDDT